MKRREKTKTPLRDALDPETWVTLYGDALFAFALLRTGDRQIAEDLVQETFLAGLRGIEGFKGRATVKTWLTGILKNKISDHYRHRKRAKIHPKPLDDVSLDDFFDSGGKWKIKPAAWSLDPEKQMQSKELMNFIQRCIETLAGKLADVFVLREIDGLSSAEICKVFDITASNLWVRLHRARTQMRHCLTNKWGDTDIAAKE
jgi:RNA polymerase sigma-70 factor (ECF subfamily)